LIEPYYKDENSSIYHGDSLEVLKNLPSESIDCCITSPPYYNLRNYGVEGQLGNEASYKEYLDKLFNIYDEVKRVLKSTGTVWINLGDSYNEDKGLYQIPARFSVGMSDRGYILRNTIIWYKPNCLPASIKDRFTVDFEYVYFFVKNKDYYFEQQLEPYAEETLNDKRFVKMTENSKTIKEGYEDAKVQNPKEIRESVFRKGLGAGRNKRCVWKITPKPFKGSHFATFPEGLVEPMILAGCPKYICNKCGKAREKIYDTDNPSKDFMEWDENRLSGAEGSFQSRQCIKSLHRNNGGVYSNSKFKGYSDCKCGSEFKGGVVLDIFSGSCTTGVVAKKLGRKFIGIELNEKYIKEIGIPRLQYTQKGLF
jgi:site-specific DNA-methyltransferase (adenine-specific)